MRLKMTDNAFFSGSTLLSPLSAATGLPIDQVNFLVCQLVALGFGYPYRLLLSPETTSPSVRHIVQLLIGFPLTLFCFGSQIKHLLIQSVVCLLLMKFVRNGLMGKAVFVVAMGYLCVCHIYRMYYDYGGYTMDISGPLMINVQRLTSLAFSVYDGRSTDDSKLTPMMKQLATKSFPSLLEFMSYVFSFHGILCGPFCFYSDYISFINGNNYQLRDTPKNSAESVNGKLAPSPNRAVLKKVIACVIYGSVSMLAMPHFQHAYIFEPSFRDFSFLYKMYFIVACTSLSRQKYYFAWSLSELVNMNAGLGFNGYDGFGQSKWDLIANFDFYEVETATSLKSLLDNWNKKTMSWLRYVVYERSGSTLAVFILSAFWHGFYGGYYLAFLGAGFFIHASRLVRRNVRPLFQTTKGKIFLYDAITFVGTRFLIAYLTFPFVMLEFWAALDLYRQLYFWMHVIGGILILIFTFKPILLRIRKKALRHSDDKN